MIIIATYQFGLLRNGTTSVYDPGSFSVRLLLTDC